MTKNKPIRSGKETLPVGTGRAAKAKIIIGQKCKVHSSQYKGQSTEHKVSDWRALKERTGHLIQKKDWGFSSQLQKKRINK